jgi:hypothetical protein
MLSRATMLASRFEVHGVSPQRKSVEDLQLPVCFSFACAAAEEDFISSEAPATGAHLTVTTCHLQENAFAHDFFTKHVSASSKCMHRSVGSSCCRYVVDLVA